VCHDLELNRAAGFVLDDCRPISHPIPSRDVVDPKTDEIATARLAVDGEIEQRQIAFAVYQTPRPRSSNRRAQAPLSRVDRLGTGSCAMLPAAGGTQ
jgi:hypothetical protein